MERLYACPRTLSNVKEGVGPTYLIEIGINNSFFAPYFGLKSVFLGQKTIT